MYHGEGGNSVDQEDLHSNAVAILSTLLPKCGPVPQTRPIQSLPTNTRTHTDTQSHNVETGGYVESPEVFVVNQPYRTTPLVLPHAKTIHDIGDPKKKFASATKDSQGQPYRTSTLVMPTPRTINDVGAGAPP